MTDTPTTPRALAEQFLDRTVALKPNLAVSLGLPGDPDQLDDLSPAGLDAEADLLSSTLAALRGLPAPTDEAERVCARLFEERLTAELAMFTTGEMTRYVSSIFSPLDEIRQTFLQMPTATEADWRVVAARLGQVPQTVAGYRERLTDGMRRGLLGGPTPARVMAEQVRSWGTDPAGGWFAGFAGGASSGVRDAAQEAAREADAAVAGFAGWLLAEYVPAAGRQGADTVGAARYAVSARYFNGADLDLAEASAWAWAEYARLDGELRAAAHQVLPGATPRQAMDHLDAQGPAIVGVDEVRRHLQGLMDAAIADLDGTHFDLAEPVRRVEAMIAPPGSAAAPYYTRPSLDFARPGRTWLPVGEGQTRFPTWDLVSTWYHEGVPGHHLQLAQWTYVADRLTRYQTTLGQVSANAEGWALYAERLMDELGYLTDPAARLGYLDAQQMRAVRVIIDIGMHLGLEIPRDQGVPQPFHPGERWTPALAREFFGANSGRPAAFLDSEIVRYLGWPGQAIGYKLGERAWLAGRDAARAAQAARGEEFDLKAWHMAALSQGSLGLDDLTAELARL